MRAKPLEWRCCSNMEQFIGCDAHKKFSVFVAVNEKGQAGEALRVAHDRQVYREFLAQDFVEPAGNSHKPRSEDLSLNRACASAEGVRQPTMAGASWTSAPFW